MDEVTVGSVWRHRNGNVYTVLALYNEYSTNREEYPVMVGYIGTNGLLWCRKLGDWHRSMKLVREQCNGA